MSTPSTLKQRFDYLCAHFRQAEIARKTGFSPNNVSRYARGKRIPLEFGRALADGLGVNPSWLLTGTGEPFVADVAPEASRTAGDLLAVVEAMQAVTRMRLGSLTGKRHATVLRDLNDALTRHETLRRKLNAHSSKLLEKFMGEMREALRKNSVRRAAEIESAAAQVSRLCDDDKLLLEFSSLRAQLFFMQGRATEALTLFRRVFMGTIARADEFDDLCLEQARRFAIALSENTRVSESVGVIRAAMALTPKSRRFGPAFAEVGFLLGYLLTLGPSLHEGLKLMQRHAAALPRNRVEVARLYLTGVQYLSGLIDMPTACALMPRLAHGARRVLALGLISASPRDLDLAMSFAQTLSGAEATRLDAFVCAAAVQRAQGKGLKRGELRKHKYHPMNRPTNDAWGFAFQARVAIAAGEQAQAADAARKAWSVIRKEPALARMQPLLMGLICRVTLLLPQVNRESRDAALEYLQRRVRWGYAAFQPLLRRE